MHFVQVFTFARASCMKSRAILVSNQHKMNPSLMIRSFCTTISTPVRPSQLVIASKLLQFLSDEIFRLNANMFSTILLHSSRKKGSEGQQVLANCHKPNCRRTDKYATKFLESLGSMAIWRVGIRQLRSEFSMLEESRFLATIIDRP